MEAMAKLRFTINDAARSWSTTHSAFACCRKVLREDLELRGAVRCRTCISMTAARTAGVCILHSEFDCLAKVT